MSTTLSPQNVSSLKQLASLSDAQIKKVAEATFKSLVDPDFHCDLSSDEAKGQIGLATLIAIYVRQGALVDTLGSTLKDNGVSQTSVQAIIELYKNNVDLLRANISKIGICYPRVIGCEWRLDYSVSNSETGPVDLPLFFVKLLLEGGTSIDFSCNEEEMTALVATLKDASQEAQRTH